MKLCYRGNEYDYNPPMLEVTESDILCQYRGRSSRYAYVGHIPFPQPVANFKYRGAAYRTNSLGQIQAAEQSTESMFAKLSSRVLKVNAIADARRALLHEAARTHNENIHQSLLHRLEVAKAQGNDGLVHQLEDEMHQMA